jgi:hypothetical protein
VEPNGSRTYAPAVADPDAIWHLDGDLAVPTELARGPWSPHAQHGGAPSALLAGLLERFEPGPADFTARLNVELMRPVPLTPLRVERTLVRPGKKVQLVQGSLFDGDVEVVRATALRLRTVGAGLGDVVPSDRTDPLPPPGDPTPLPIRLVVDDTVGFWNAVETSTAGVTTRPEERHAVLWFRLVRPVIGGESPSPLQRVAAVADFGNGISMTGLRGRYTFINPDLTIVLHRLPIGEWVALDARSFPEDAGIGLVESELCDEQGRIGRALQTIILDER